MHVILYGKEVKYRTEMYGFIHVWFQQFSYPIGALFEKSSFPAIVVTTNVMAGRA